jgi:antitoxin Phd
MNSKTWQLQDAKNRFSELVRRATDEGPQFVSKHGKTSVVVVSVEEYNTINSEKGSLVEFFQNSPLSTVKLDLTRDTSTDRDISL